MFENPGRHGPPLPPVAKAQAIKPLPGGGTEKKTKNSKKTPKNCKNLRKQHFLASLYYICTMYKNPGEPRPLAADAHV